MKEERASRRGSWETRGQPAHNIHEEDRKGGREGGRCIHAYPYAVVIASYDSSRVFIAQPALDGIRGAARVVVELFNGVDDGERDVIETRIQVVGNPVFQDELGSVISPVIDLAPFGIQIARVCAGKRREVCDENNGTQS